MHSIPVADLFPDCQRLAEGIEEYRYFKGLGDRFVDHTWIVDMDGKDPVPALLVHCEITKRPRVGITVLPPKNSACITSQADTTAQVEYAASEKQLEALRNVSTYSRQGVTYECRKAPLKIDGNFGAYDWNDTAFQYWTENTGEISK